mmetsp:Transcript_9992/g.27821  ORF Transcript_9992/g.27821 Transcript_9992/m.27821 type:complete len:212 (+) Transcript_9992:469-1104(+)
MPSCSECPEMLPHTCERRVARSIRLPPLLPLPTLRTLHRRIWPTRNMDVRSNSSSISSSSDSDSDSDSDSSPASFLPPFRLATGARTSEASARVTVPLRPFGSDTVSPRSLTSVTTPSTFMPTRRVLYLSSSTNLLSPPVFFAPGDHAGAPPSSSSNILFLDRFLEAAVEPPVEPPPPRGRSSPPAPEAPRGIASGDTSGPTHSSIARASR